MSEFCSVEEFHKEISDGIKDGRYFADFDGSGIFDPIDAFVVLKYYGYLGSLSEEASIDDIDWNDDFMQIQSYNEEFWKNYNYEILESDIGTFFLVPLNNEMLENVKKYGDINGDGTINAIDATSILSAYSELSIAK